LLKETIYIEKPALCACDPNTEGNLFVLDRDGRSAAQITVHYGQSAGSLVEVRDGLKPGDKVIISDMNAYYDSYPRIDLR